MLLSVSAGGFIWYLNVLTSRGFFLFAVWMEKNLCCSNMLTSCRSCERAKWTFRDCFLLFNFSQKEMLHYDVFVWFFCFSSWSLDNGEKLLRELEIPKNAETRNLYPEDYRRLFEAMQNSNTFTETWFHDEVLESIRNINL